jgi:pilus assembly protein TadC
MGKAVANLPIRFILHLRIAERLAEWKIARLSPLIRRSGLVVNPAVLATRSTAEALACAMAATPLAAALAFLVSPWASPIALAPLVLFFIPELRLRDRAAQRREEIERELPFFSVVVNVLAGAGVPLYSILQGLASSHIFEATSREALLVGRDVKIFGMNPQDSIERLASDHPSRRFADFLLGYTSKVRSGGDVALYLSGESGSLLRGLEEGWVRYVSRIGIVGSMMVTAFGVVPLLLMVVGIFSPGFSFLGLVLFTGMGVPLVTITLLYMSGRMQPVREEPVRGKAVRGVLLALPAAVAGLSFGGAWVSVGAALLAFFLAYGLSIREQLEQTKAVEDGLARFLKDLLEYKRQDYDLTRAILATQAGAKYNPRFSRLLSRVASQLKAGVPLEDVKADCRSSLGKLAFLLLGEMSRSGGGTVDTVYQVSSFADRMTEMKRSAAAELKPYVMLSYVSPLLLAFGVAFVRSVLSSFGGAARPVIAGIHAGLAQTSPPAVPLAQLSSMLIVASAASLGLVAAKIADFTVRNTLRAAANVALAMVALSAAAVLGSHLLPRLV